jgi:hypothetical protein
MLYELNFNYRKQIPTKDECERSYNVDDYEVVDYPVVVPIITFKASIDELCNHHSIWGFNLYTSLVYDKLQNNLIGHIWDLYLWN